MLDRSAVIWAGFSGLMMAGPRVANTTLTFPGNPPASVIEVENAWTKMQDEIPHGPRHEALSQCLDQLPPDRRALLHQRYAHGVSISDLAASADRSEASTKMLLHRLRLRLADCVEERSKEKLR